METESVEAVRRVDMHLSLCPVCNGGTLQFIIYAPEEVVCSRCRATLLRWMTKKERLERMNDNS